MKTLSTYLFVLCLLATSRLSAQIALPLEVLGSDGYVEEATFNLEETSGITHLYLKIHRPSYRDALSNPERGAKASVQLNNGNWIDLTNKTAEVYEPAASYGGLGGGFHTLPLKLPISNAQTGKNTLRFRFNGTDGFTSGYRVLEFNLLRGERAVLSSEQFSQDNPARWSPPLNNAADIAQGRELWNNKPLLESSLSSSLLKATCGDCHAQDGRDLKYFNYSNWAIEERSKFHGLSDTEARQIASYIRSLDAPAPAQARPWNPPYQPGPGLDGRPAEEWAAGVGLDGVLKKDADMLPYLFPKGTSEAAIAKVVDTDRMLNLRELPVALQFPDWNEWLPESHPLDVFPATFEPGKANQAYYDLRTELSANRDYLISSKKLPDRLGTLMNGTIGYFTEGQTDNHWQWRVRESPVLNTRHSAFSVERAKEQLAKWVAVKSWEVMTEFRLEEVAPKIYKRGELRAWPLKTRSVFNIAPHIVGKNKNHFDDQSPLLGEYRSSVWYQLQMTLNAGQKEPTAEHPVDWPYQQRHLRELAERSEVWDGLRHIATNIKAYQERDNGNGPARRGWELRVTHPHWLYSNPNGDTRLMESLDKAAGGLKNRIVNSMLREFLERVNSPGFEPENWTRCDHSESIPSTERWYCVEPEDYVPVAYTGAGFTRQTYQFKYDNYYGPDKIFFFPENYHADNFYRLVPLLEQSGVDLPVLNALIDWCQVMWPAGDWDSLRPKETTTLEGTYQIIARHSNKALDVSGKSAADGANVQQWSYVGGSNQQWQIASAGNGYYTLKAKHSGKALAVDLNPNTNGGKENPTDKGTNIFHLGTNDDDNRLWKIESVGEGYYKLVNKYSGKVLDVSGVSKANGANVHQWEYGGSPNQQWKLVLVDAKARLASSWDKFKAPDFQQTEPTLRTYPNPASEQLTVEATGSENYQLTLYDMSGRVVMQYNHQQRVSQLNVSQLRPGVYVVRLRDREQREVRQQIVVE